MQQRARSRRARREKRNAPNPAVAQTEPAVSREWKPCLVQRTYGRSLRPFPFKELSVRIEHDGSGLFFPLGTALEEEAATRAKEIRRRTVAEGWLSVFKEYPREFTLAIFWSDDPMVFTYATLYTVPEREGRFAPVTATPIPRSGRIAITIVEPDAFCGRALRNWVNGLPGCTCSGLFAKAAPALEAIKSAPAALVLINRRLPDLPAEGLLRTLRQGRPYVPALGYRIYDTSDDLFISQPRVLGGYYFRRRSPKDLLEPIRDAGNPGSLNPGEWQARVYDYVKRLFLSPTGPDRSRIRAPLTCREREILGCLCRGIPDKEIARTLDISAWTVHTHLKRIYEKLGVHSRAKAILRFLET